MTKSKPGWDLVTQMVVKSLNKLLYCGFQWHSRLYSFMFQSLFYKHKVIKQFYIIWYSPNIQEKTKWSDFWRKSSSVVGWLESHFKLGDRFNINSISSLWASQRILTCVVWKEFPVTVPLHLTGRCQTTSSCSLFWVVQVKLR